jgi:predicted amidophosphoribosyltransferase
MPVRTDTPNVGVPKHRAPERLETTGELELVCVVCGENLPESKRVLCWNLGGLFVVACIDCDPSVAP